jgi:phosphatidylserine/phosphatidylglycerophosphate/cardiolipin synthase-like enzyme
MQKLTTESSKSSFTSQTSGTMNPAHFFKPVTFENLDLTIQPLLTPDPGQHTTLYVDHVLALINSATRSLYMQTQYIQPSDIPEDKDFQLLIQAFSDAHKRGVDVRLITSQYENVPQWIEKLKAFDLDQVLRIQERVHNKGMVVDSTTVMVSSMNWSPNGILRNRDAGVIIRHAGIAAYFESIFLSDWVGNATEKIVDVSHSV